MLDSYTHTVNTFGFSKDKKKNYANALENNGKTLLHIIYYARIPFIRISASRFSTCYTHTHTLFFALSVRITQNFKRFSSYDMRTLCACSSRLFALAEKNVYECVLQWKSVERVVVVICWFFFCVCWSCLPLAVFSLISFSHAHFHSFCSFGWFHWIILAYVCLNSASAHT